MSDTSIKNNSLNGTDEIDLFEIFEALWNSRVLILLITLVTLSTGLLYNFTRTAPTPVYKISTQAQQKNDITTSIILSNLWVNSSEKNLAYFATRGMAKYGLGNNPYSPNALFIRALEKINSFEERTQYLDENKMGMDFEISFPARISGTFKISTSTTSQAEIEGLKLQMVEYIRWSLARFDQVLLEEAKLLNGNSQDINLPVPFYISEVRDNLIVMKKPKAKLIIALSILLYAKRSGDVTLSQALL